MSTLSNSLVVVFAKNPVPGKVKTRLAKRHGLRFSCLAYKTLLQHSMATLAALPNIQLAASPHIRHGSIRKLAREHHIGLSAQATGKLGQRMAKTIRQGLKQYQAVIIIGTDCPYLSLNDIEAAAEACSHKQHYIQPAEDGGYVLVACSQYEPALFQQIQWSSTGVMRQTLRQARRCKLPLKLGPSRVDIDYQQDWKNAQRQLRMRPLYRR